jgi:predicted amidohydrolase
MKQGGEIMKPNTTLVVSAIQMDCVMGDKEKNLARAEQLITEAAAKHAKLIVLPELFNTAYRVEEKDYELAEAIPGPTSRWMSELSQKYDVTLIGCILERGEGRGIVYDTSLITTKDGLIGTYRKIHLWDQESRRFKRGDQLPVFELEWGKIGLQICYEIGFPEGARILALKGADIIVYPSAFGKPRFYAWNLATRSRALENGCFVIAPNRTGTEKQETVFGGKSRIVDPSGQILAEASSDNEVITAEIDLNLVKEQRSKIPYLKDFNKQLIIKELENL